MQPLLCPMKTSSDLYRIPVVFPVSTAGQTLSGEVVETTHSLCADKLISKQWSLVSTKLVGLLVWLPSPKAARMSIVPCAFRCVVFGVTSLKLMGEGKEVKKKKEERKKPGIVFSCTSPPVPGVMPTWQDLEIADALWIKMT